jgi:hypothetical protein
MATVLTQAGEEWIVDKLDVATRADWCAWGSGAGAAGKGRTTLYTEETEARIQGVTTQPLADMLQVVGTMVCLLLPKTITNAGLFTANAGPTLVLMGDFTGIPLLVNDAIQFTYTLEIT